MALALRIDSVTPVGNGKAVVGLTYGQTPLPAEASGQGMELSISQMSDAVAQADVQGTFLLMAFAKWKQANPALDNPSIIVGHVLTFDVTQAINLVRLT